MTVVHAVKVGQFWADNDCRGIKRQIEIMLVRESFAIVKNIITNRQTSVRLDRFRPNATGYRLLKDV